MNFFVIILFLLYPYFIMSSPFCSRLFFGIDMDDAIKMHDEERVFRISFPVLKARVPGLTLETVIFLIKFKK